MLEKVYNSLWHEAKEKKEMKNIAKTTVACVALLVLAGCSDTPASTSAQSTSVVSSVVETPPVSTSAVASDDVTVMSHDEYIAAAVDSNVVIEAYVQGKQSWWDNAANVYAQDEDGGYFLYGLPCSEDDYAKLEEGTKIRVNGYKAEWSGEIEIVDATYEIIDGNKVFDAVDATDLLGSDELASHQNEKVAFKGMTVEKNDNGEAFMYNWDGSGERGNDLYFNVSLNGETYSFTVESYLCNQDSDVYKAVEALEGGETVDLEGFLYWYEGPNPHITSLTVR